MASPLRLAVHPTDHDRANAPAARSAWRDIVAEFDAVEAAMSRFRPESELSRLNRHAADTASVAARAASRRVRSALVLADRAWRVTRGRFDPRVARALEALGFRGSEGRIVPLPPAVEGPERVGRPVEVEPRSSAVRLAEPVDLGGLGKGLALRWAMDRAARGPLRAVLDDGGGVLLEAGGDVVVRGHPGDGRWRVAIEDPGGDSTARAVVALSDAQAVATSSVRLNAWRADDGRAAHHLIDPETGLPGGDGLASVTVVAGDPAWAEIWTKALFLEGVAGIAPAARARGLAAWWVTSDGALEMTPAARVRTIWPWDAAARAADVRGR